MPRPRTLTRIFQDAPTVGGPSLVRGSRPFLLARHRLADLAKREPEQVSEADVAEFLRRGELATQAYLATVSSH